MIIHFTGTLAQCKSQLPKFPKATIKKESHKVCTIDWLKEEFVLTMGVLACSPETYKTLPRTSIMGFEEDTDWMVVEYDLEDY